MPPFNSSLILEKIRTFASTAIPTVKTIPAIPGNVSVAPSNDIIPVIRTRLEASATFAANPNLFVLNFTEFADGESSI